MIDIANISKKLKLIKMIDIADFSRFLAVFELTELKLIEFDKVNIKFKDTEFITNEIKTSDLNRFISGDLGYYIFLYRIIRKCYIIEQYHQYAKVFMDEKYKGPYYLTLAPAWDKLQDFIKIDYTASIIKILNNNPEFKPSKFVIDLIAADRAPESIHELMRLKYYNHEQKNLDLMCFLLFHNHGRK